MRTPLLFALLASPFTTSAVLVEVEATFAFQSVQVYERPEFGLLPLPPETSPFFPEPVDISDDYQHLVGSTMTVSFVYDTEGGILPPPPPLDGSVYMPTLPSFWTYSLGVEDPGFSISIPALDFAYADAVDGERWEIDPYSLVFPRPQFPITTFFFIDRTEDEDGHFLAGDGEPLPDRFTLLLNYGRRPGEEDTPLSEREPGASMVLHQGDKTFVLNTHTFVIPEPGTLGLLLLGGAGALLVLWRRRKV